IFGSLAVFLAPVFFPSKTLGTSLILYLGTFAAGFAVRPFGALVFGRLGDKIGRKYAFLLTITIMGSATTVIGLLPAYQAIGALHTMAAPRNTALHQTQRNGKNGEIPDQRKYWNKLASHSSRSVRRHCRAGRGMVHWTILCALLFTNDSRS